MMTYTRKMDVLKNTIRLRQKWAIWLHFSKSLFFAIKKIDDKAPGGVQACVDYLKAAYPLTSKSDPAWFELWLNEEVLLHFDSESEALEFKARVPEGSLLSLELYNPQGEFWGDNT